MGTEFKDGRGEYTRLMECQARGPGRDKVSSEREDRTVLMRHAVIEESESYRMNMCTWDR